MARVALVLTMLLLPGWAYAELDPFGFSEEDYSSWGIVDAPYPYDPAAQGEPNNYGCFPVGNGQVFAYLGVDGDFNTLRGITGPGYQTRTEDGAAVYWEEGEWPEQSVELWRMDSEPRIVDGERKGTTTRYTPIEWTEQSIRAVRGAAVVRTHLSGPEGSLYCLTYAVAGQPGIVREFAFDPKNPLPDEVSYALVTPPGSDAVSRLYPKMWYGTDADLWLHSQWEFHIGDQKYYMLTGDGDQIPRVNLVLEFIDRDSPARRQQVRDTGSADIGPNLGFRQETVDEYRATTVTHWLSWSAGNLRFDTGDLRLDDLMIQLPVIIETQRDAYSGGAAPMVSYHGYWVRDSLGPMLTYLANGRYEEMTRMLRYHRAACLKLGFCHMLVPLDLDLSDLAGWQPDVGAGLRPAQGGSETRPYATAGDLSGIGVNAADWEGIGFEHAEVPSLIVLQHYWLWRAMHFAGRGEKADAFIAEAWPFIAHNLFGMQFDPDFGVRFHGDETYTHGSLYSTYDRAESGQIGYPNGYIPTDFFSFDNTQLHAAACRGAYFMAEKLFGTKGGIRQLDEMPEILSSIADLTGRVDSALSLFHRERSYAPAISSTTYQRWPAPFANMSLAPWSLPVQGLRVYADQYLEARELLCRNPKWLEAGEPRLRYWTTPWSGYATGHSLGGWLNAARANRDDDAAGELVDQLLLTASPEGAWCEVLSPGGLPVDIYGRTNRIRPWESGINYLMLAAYLAERDQLTVESAERKEQLLSLAAGIQPTGSQVPLSGKEWHRSGGRDLASHIYDYPDPPPDTQLLVLTVDNHYTDLIAQDERLKDIAKDRIAVWDAGLPFSHADLRETLLGSSVGAGLRPAQGGSETRPYEEGGALRISCFYFDREVRGGLSRRTFKDEDFWQGTEMTHLLADYGAAGGVVIDEDSMELSLAADEAVALRLLVVLCTSTFTHEMTAEEIATFHQEVAEWIAWYDEVAGDRLCLELDYLQIDQGLSPGMCGPQGESTWWMDYDDVEGLLRDRGIPDDYYDSVCCFYSWDRDYALPGGEKAAQAYGGAAQGPADDMDFLGQAGRTSYFGSAALISHPDGPSKVAIHEYLHNVDAMFEEIGDPRLFHPDHMARNMETLLREVPGGFEQWDLSDDEMRLLAEQEARGEAGFPWRTQLVYYQRALQRIPREDYARLLTRFGRRTNQQTRTRLYEQLILPDGAEGMQLWWAETADAEPVQLTDSDSTEDEQLNWQQTLWASAPDEAGVRRYAELELLTDDVIEYVIGEDDGPLSVWLTPTDSGEGYGLADVWAEIRGEQHAMWCVGDGAYVCPLPAGLGERTAVTFHAEAEGYACSPVPAMLRLKPPWELSAQFRTTEAGQYGLMLEVDGPPGGYKLSAEMSTEFNTIQQLLADEGLLYDALLTAEVEALPGAEVALGGGFTPIDTAAYPLTVRVDYVSEDGMPASFIHNYPAPRSLSSLLRGLSPDELPEYIPVAKPLREDAEPGKTLPAGVATFLHLDPDSGNVFSGNIDGPDDASLKMRFYYDEEYLIIDGMVIDDMTPTGGVWSVDRINLVFDAELNTTRDTYPDGAVGHSGWQRDDYWVFLAPFAEGGPLAMRLGGERPSGGKNGYYGEVVGATADVKLLEGGASGIPDALERAYHFTWKIPWEALPYLDPEPGRLVGFTVFYSDYDEGLSELMYLTDWGGANGIEWRFHDCGLLYFE